jgi:cholesterol oxidase
MRSDSKPLEEGYLVEDGAIPNGLASIVPELFAASSAIIGQKTPGGDWVAQEYRELQSITQGAHYGATNNSQSMIL